MERPGVVVRHHGVDALVEVVDAVAVERAGHAEHDVGAAAIVVRMGEAVGMAEFVQDDGEGEAALQQALLLVEIPAAAVDVERADALRRRRRPDPADRNRRRNLLGRRRDQPELGLGLVGGLDIVDAEDLGIFARAPSITCCFSNAFQPNEGSGSMPLSASSPIALAGGRRNRPSPMLSGADVDIVGGEPVDRVERIEVGEVELLEGDRIAAGPGRVGLKTSR